MLERTFTDAASATAFFDDQVFALPTAAALAPSLTLNLSLTSDDPGAGFAAMLLVNNTVVPERGAGALLVALAPLALRRRRARRRTRSRAHRLV